MVEPYRPFEEVEKAFFISRPNRFTILCEKEGRTINVHLPNPGRLEELLLPGRRIYLVKEDRNSGRKTHYTAVAVEKEEIPIFLHTLYANRVARYLIEGNAIPGMAGARVVSSEVRMGHSRFDILLEKGGDLILMEVKSCTLVGKRIAMFPDALTERGTRHIQDLSRVSRSGIKASVLFIVHWPHAIFFIPDYHVDFSFAKACLENRERIDFIPVSVRWRDDMSICPHAERLYIPWEIIEREAKDRGSYILILRLEKDLTLPVGGLGHVSFRRGFYVYTGSAMANLKRRMERHKRIRKRNHWHIDFLRSVSEFHDILPIRSSERIECQLANCLSGIACWEIPGFGSSDCECRTHLFGWEVDPLLCPEFHSVIQYFRMDRLL